MARPKAQVIARISMNVQQGCGQKVGFREVAEYFVSSPLQGNFLMERPREIRAFVSLEQ